MKEFTDITIFDSFEEFLELTKMKHEDTPSQLGTHQRTSRSNRALWKRLCRHTSHTDTVKLVETGWTDAPDISAGCQDVTAHYNDLARKVKYDVSGDRVDMGLFFAGVPEHMVSRPNRIAKPGVRIGIQVGALADVSADQMMFRGATALALYDLLNKSGYDVEIILFSSVKVGHDPEQQHYMEIPFKKKGQNIDVNGLAFWTAHAAAYRRIIFSAKENLSTEIVKRYGFKADSGKGYGRTATPKAEEIDCDFVISELPCNAQHAAEILERMLTKFNATMAEKAA